MDEQEKNEFEKLKAEIEQIRKDYSSAKNILSNINQFNDTFLTLKTLINDSESGVQANFNLAKNQKEQIEALFTQTQGHSNEIASSLQKVRVNIESMQTAYSEFSEMKGKVSGVNGEIETLLTTSRSLHNDISTTKKESLVVLESIKSTYQAVAENIKNMQTAYQEFLQITSKINDKKTGLQAIFDSAQSLNSQSDALFTEIKTFRDNSKAFLSEIEQNKNQTEKLKTDIQENFDFTVSKKAQIEEATGLIIDTSFAQTFRLRQLEIEKGLYSWRSWKNIFFVSILLLAFSVLYIAKLSSLGNIPWYELFLTRIFYTSPILFLLAFSAVQYSKERDLAEKYAFKASSSSAIRSHIDYLVEKFAVDENGVVLGFAKDTFSTIYKEPYSTHDGLEKRMKELEKKQNSNVASHAIDMNEIVNNVKALKELLPEKSVFEKVLNVFVK